MKTKLEIVVVAFAFLAGCSGKGNGGGGSGGHGGTGGNGGGGGQGGGVGGNGDGGAPGGDMADTTPMPAPVTKLVGAGNASMLATDGNQHAAYLLNAAAVTSGSNTLGTAGELHVASASGTDTKVATGVYQHNFVLAPNGKAIFWVNFQSTSTGQASLMRLDLTQPNATAQSVFAKGMAVTTYPSALAPIIPPSYGPAPFTGVFTPSGNYLLVPVYAAADATTPDLHIVETATGKDVYQRPNGGAVYQQLVLPDDTLIFQDTAGGSGSASTPVQTLYWVKLGGSAAAAAITMHTASFQPTADGKTLVILKTSGDLVAWDLVAKSGSGNVIAHGATAYSLGLGAKGPVAYVSGDGSLHVVGTDGQAVLDVATSAGGDVDGTPVIAPDGMDVYYWQNVEQQESRGTLMRVALQKGAAPSKVADKVSTADLYVTDGRIVFLQNVDDLGQLGDAATAARDGSGIMPLGQKASVGGLRVVNPGPDTWFALHLSGAAVDSNTTLDGSPAISGGLAFAGAGLSGDVMLSSKVQALAYAFSDDGRDAAYIGGAAFASGAYAGALSFVATRAPMMSVDAKLGGVTELGPIVSRSLFVAAPRATMPGVYFVTF